MQSVDPGYSQPQRRVNWPQMLVLLGGMAIVLLLLLTPGAPTLPRITVENVGQLREILRLESGLQGSSPNQFVLSADGRSLFVNMSNRNELWQLDKGTKQTMNLRDSGGYTPVLFFNNNQPISVFADWISTVKFLDMETGATIQSFGNFRQLRLYDDWTLSPDHQWLVYKTDRKTLSIDNIWTGEHRFTITAPDGYEFVRPVPTFSPDSRLLAASVKRETDRSWDIYVWDAVTGAEVKHLGNFTQDGHVGSMAFSHDGRLLVIGGGTSMDVMRNSLLQVWDMTSYTELAAWSSDGLTITELQFSANGRYLAANGYGNLWLLDVTMISDTGEVRQVIYLESDGSTSAYDVVAFNPDSTLMAVSTPLRVIMIYDVQSGQVVRLLFGHRHYIRDLVFSRDGRMLVSAGTDGTVRFWAVREYPPYSAQAGYAETALPAALPTPSLIPPLRTPPPTPAP